MAKDKRKSKAQAVSALNKVRHRATFKPTKWQDDAKKSIPAKPNSAKPTARPGKQQQQAVVPFTVYDKILLIGEGNFSFATSLVLDHGVSDLLATSYDNYEDLLQKYGSTAASNVAAVNLAFDHTLDGAGDDTQNAPTLFGIDATKLDKNKQLRKRGPFTRIIFNFPHTGGLYTDVNRQVRANQALLSSFFHTCIPLLSTAPKDEDMDADMAASPPSILVTLFEGEPYTLWNIRDLARSADLVVERSFRFPKEAYPRYNHARTAGVIRQGGENGVQESTSAWKGEDRLARTYEFRLKDSVASTALHKDKSKKKGGDSSDSDG